MQEKGFYAAKKAHIYKHISNWITPQYHHSFLFKAVFQEIMWIWSFFCQQPSTSSCSRITGCLRCGHQRVSKGTESLIRKVIGGLHFPQLTAFLSFLSPTLYACYSSQILQTNLLLWVWQLPTGHNCVKYTMHCIIKSHTIAKHLDEISNCSFSPHKNILLPFSERGQRCPEKSQYAKNVSCFQSPVLKPGQNTLFALV